MKTKPVVALCCLVAFALSTFGLASTADADLVTPLIVVDVSDPSAVTFSATGAFPSVADDSTNTFDGVTFVNFFGASFNVAPFTAVTGDLTPNGATAPYDLAFNGTVSATTNDIFLYDGSDPLVETQNFLTTNAAFTGSATIDLGSASLPAPGTTGDIYAGRSFEIAAIEGSLDLPIGADAAPGLPIGTFAVVPEPSAFLYGGLISVLAGCGYRIKRRLAVS